MVRANDRLRHQWKNAPAQAQACAVNIQTGLKDTLDEHPVEMTLMAFGIGLGVGIGLGLLMMDSMLPRRASASPTIASTLTRVLPDALTRHFSLS